MLDDLELVHFKNDLEAVISLRLTSNELKNYHIKRQLVGIMIDVMKTTGIASWREDGEIREIETAWSEVQDEEASYMDGLHP